ncbi:MAG: ABC transporter ATP-binding protein [bacterium]|nr:ABC transporter ATP-binding protein [bacterium]
MSDSSTRTPAVAVRGLTKSYGPVRAVRGISFEVAAGEVFALLGPNGAGKSTTVEILEGHRRADSGDVSVLGFDPAVAGREFRDRTGIVLQEATIDTSEVTVAEALDTFGAAYRHPRDRDEVIEFVGLAGKQNARLKTLSGGQQRRVDMALGLIGDPDLLFLDEPTTGFDPEARRAAWDMIKGLRSLGRTIILTTHYMEEAEHLADRVALLMDGQIVACAPPSQLLGSERSTVRFRLPAGAGRAELPALVAATVEIDGDVAVVNTERPTALLAELTGWASQRGIELADLTVSPPSLEDAYLQLIGTDGDPDDAG